MISEPLRRDLEALSQFAQVVKSDLALDDDTVLSFLAHDINELFTSPSDRQPLRCAGYLNGLIGRSRGFIT